MEQIVKMVQSKDDLTNMPKRAAAPARFGKALMGGGMGIADKQKLKEMTETQERIVANQKRVMEQLRNINFDDIKRKVSEIELGKAKKTEIDEVMKKVLEAT